MAFVLIHNISSVHAVSFSDVYTNDSTTFTKDENVTRVGTLLLMGYTDINNVSASVSGRDASYFTVSVSTSINQVIVFFKNPGDYEDQANYSITVSVDEPGDGDGPDTLTVIVNLNDLNEAPTLSGPRTVHASDRTPSGQLIGGSFTGSDPDTADGDTDVDPETTGTQDLTYTLAGTDSNSFTLDTSGNTVRLRTAEVLNFENQNSYSVEIQVSDGALSSDPLEVRITETPPPPPPPPVTTDESADGASSNPHNPHNPHKTVVRQFFCPVGWQRHTGFGTLTPRVLISAVEVDIDMNNPIGIYTPTAIEIYKDTTEERVDLNGWKLILARLYNTGKEYHLTAENSAFNDAGILRIEAADVEGGLPIVDATVIGQRLPGFDYRLYDENNMRVDFGISCYYDTVSRVLLADLQSLQAMTSPRVERNLNLANLEWTGFYRSEWRVPEVSAPAAPSARPLKMTTMWGLLKKQ